MILFYGILAVLVSDTFAASMTYTTMDVGNPTGNLVASAEARSKLQCASYCLTLLTEIFNYVAPMCLCYDGSSVGATFVNSPTGLYGKAQVRLP